MSNGFEIDQPAKARSGATTGMGVLALVTFLILAVVVFLQVDENSYMKGKGMFNSSTDQHATQSVIPN